MNDHKTAYLLIFINIKYLLPLINAINKSMNNNQDFKNALVKKVYLNNETFKSRVLLSLDHVCEPIKDVMSFA